MNRRSPDPEFLPSPMRRPSGAGSEGLELGAVAGALGRRKWLILASILIAGLLAWGVLHTVRPSYDSYVEVLLDTRQERLLGIEQVVSDLNVTNSVVAGEIAVLRSNLLLGQVVDELDLVHNPDFDPTRIEKQSLPARALEWGRVWLAAMGFGEKLPGSMLEPMPEATPDAEGGLSAQDARNLVIWAVRRNLGVSQSGISYVISISMRAHDPDIAASIANAVAGRYLKDQLAAKQGATQRAIKWLDTRLIDLERQLRDAEDAVVEFLAKQVLDEGNDKDSVAQQLTEMNRAIVVARNDSSAAAAQLDHVRRLLARDGTEAAAAVLTTPRLANLDTERAALERSRAQLGVRLGPQHPQMLALTQALDDLVRDRDAAVQNGVDDLAATLAQAQGRETAIRADIVKAQLLQVELSRSSVRLSQLERSASAMRQVYESFLARFQETTQQLDLQRPDARIITAGVPALSPSAPRQKLIVAVALTFGAVIGIAAALARTALDRSVGSAGELHRLTGLTVMAALPAVKAGARLAGWRRTRPTSMQGNSYTEGIRFLRFGLMNASGGVPPRVIMLTGAEAGAGCSAAILGLARTFAAIGRRVVIVDANFRRPAQARMLRIAPGHAGITDFMAGTATLDEIVIQDVERNLSLVIAGDGIGNGADMISAERFGTMLADLWREHDVVLIDAAPTTGVADTTLLAGLTDAIVVVARAHRTRGEAVVAAIDALEKAGGRVVGTVLTHIESSAAPSSRASVSPRHQPERPWKAALRKDADGSATPNMPVATPPAPRRSADV